MTKDKAYFAHSSEPLPEGYVAVSMEGWPEQKIRCFADCVQAIEACTEHNGGQPLDISDCKWIILAVVAGGTKFPKDNEMSWPEIITYLWECVEEITGEFEKAAAHADLMNQEPAGHG